MKNRCSGGKKLHCVCVCVCAGAHYSTTPSFSSINPEVGQLVVESVSINSGYTSKVLVSPQHFFFLFLFCFDSALDENWLLTEERYRQGEIGGSLWQVSIGSTPVCDKKRASFFLF